MKTKINRLQIIRELISKYKIENQEELLKHLAENGYDLTQATLSRDLRALKAVKVPDSEGLYHYVFPSENRIDATSNLSAKEIVNKGGVSIEFSGQLAIIKTRPGYANAIAGDIDAYSPIEIMGTIAGDDTILLILHESANKEQLVEHLSMFIPHLINGVFENK